MKIVIFAMVSLVLIFTGCTQETQNKISRTFQNWTGSHGILKIYSGGKVVAEFFEIDKLSTAYGTDDNRPRPYRYGYGYLDQNRNGILDKDEKRKKVYFEVSEYSQYLFYDNPNE